MTWNNEQLNHQQENRPERIRLSDGTTKTGDEITDNLLNQLGWEWIETIKLENGFIK